MNKRGRIAIVTLILVIGGIGALPTLLSTGPSRQALLARINRHLPGQLTMESCSFGWWQGLRCDRLRYEDPVNGLRFEAPQLVGDKGLLLLLLAPAYLGEFHLEQPLLTLLSKPPPPRPAPFPQADTPLLTKSWWERLALRLTVHQGQVTGEQGPTMARALAHQVDWTASLAQGVVEYELKGRAVQQAGQYRVKGVVSLPVPGQPVLSTLVFRSALEINDLELADLLALAASRGVAPNGSGRLSANVQLQAAGPEDLSLRGSIDLNGVALGGELMAGDHPKLDQLRCTFIGSRRPGAGWRLPVLDVRSGPVNFSAHGELTDKEMHLRADGQADLTALAGQIPNLLGLHRLTRITGGNAGFTMDLSGNGGQNRLQTKIHAEGIRWVHNGQAYLWDTPLILEAEGRSQGDAVAVDLLRLQSPFFTALGRGGLDDFSLEGGGDLGQLSQSLQRIFALRTLASGQVNLAATSRRGADGGYGLDSRVSIRDFAVSRDGVAVLPAHPLQCTLKTKVTSAFPRTLALQALQAELNSLPATVAVQAEDMQASTPEAKDQPTCMIRGAADLGRVSALLPEWLAARQWSKLAGALDWTSSGWCTERSLSLATLRGQIKNLALTVAGVSLTEPSLQFALGEVGRGTISKVQVQDLQVLDKQEQPLLAVAPPRLRLETDRHRLEINRLTWSGSTLHLQTDLTVDGWQLQEPAFAATLRGSADGAVLSAGLQAPQWLPGDWRIKGKAQGSVTTTRTAAGQRQGAVALTLDRWSLMQGDTSRFADDQTMVRASFENGEPGRHELRLPAFFLNTAPGRLEGAGLLRTGDGNPTLQLQGKLTMHHQEAAPLLRSLLGPDIALEGSQPSDFLLSLPLTLPVPWEQVTFSTQLPLEHLRVLGSSFKPQPVEVDCNLGKLHLRLDESLGHGRVQVAPVWDLTGRWPALHLESDQPVLHDVAVQAGLARSLVERLHPLFGSLAEPRGRLDLRVERLSAAGTANGWAAPDFKVHVVLDRLKFNPIGPLKSALNLDNVNQEWIGLSEREMACEGKGGRITCTPVHLATEAAAVEIAGALEPDGRLHYQVRMPVDKTLAEKANLSVQGAVMAVAEMGGTRQRPVFDAGAFVAGLSAQLRQNLGAAVPLAEGPPPAAGPASPSASVPAPPAPAGSNP